MRLPYISIRYHKSWKQRASDDVCLLSYFFVTLSHYLSFLLYFPLTMAETRLASLDVSPPPPQAPIIQEQSVPLPSKNEGQD